MSVKSEHIKRQDGSVMLFVLNEWCDFRVLCYVETHALIERGDIGVEVVAEIFAEEQELGPYRDAGGVVMLTSADLVDCTGVPLLEVRRVLRVMVKAGVLRRLSRGYVPNACLRSDAVRRGHPVENDAFDAAEPLQRLDAGRRLN